MSDLAKAASVFSESVSPDLFSAFSEGISLGWMVVCGIIALLGSAACIAFLVPAVSRFILPAPKDTRLADYLPFHKLLDDGKTLLCKKGEVIQCIEVLGRDTTFLTNGEREAQGTARKNWIDSLSEIGVKIRVFVIRERVNASEVSAHSNGILKKIADRWNHSFTDSFQNRQIIVLSAEASNPKQALNKLEDATESTLTILADYHPRVLSQDLEPGGSRDKLLLSFWARIISPLSKPTPNGNDEDITDVLTADTVIFGGEEGDILFQSGHKKLYMAAVGIRKFGDQTEENMMTDLGNIGGELTILHLIEPWSKGKSSIMLLQQSRMLSATGLSGAVNDQFKTAMEAIDGMDETAQSMSRYSMVIFIQGRNLQEIEDTEAEIRKVCANYGATAVREGVAAQASWFSQFPSYDKWPRAYKLFSWNISSLVTLARMPGGLPKSDWGNGPIALFRTAGGTVYDFQFHVSSEKDAVAHGVTIGPTGGGKTTLMCFLAGMAMRHQNLRTYIFDRFHGAYIFCKAAQGNYITFNTGQSDSQGNTSLNPFQCDDRDENRQFLRQWLRNVSGCNDARSLEEIGLAVSENFDSLGREQRSLRSLFDACFTPDGQLRLELQKWVAADLYGNMFNAERDTLDLSSTRLTAFDFTRIFEDEDLTRAALSYLMHRIQATITEQNAPALLFIDETEPMLRHPLFRQYFLVMLQEYRKRGAAVISAFQRPEAIAKTGMSETIRGQAQTAYFLPNPQAKEEDYADWGLTDREWAFISGKLSLSRKLKRGIMLKRATGESVVLDVDLSPLGPSLKLFSSGRSSVKLAMDLEKQFPQDWINHYMNAD